MPVAHGQKGVAQELHKFKAGRLHSGSSTGPVVKSRRQAIAIAMHAAGISRNATKGGPPSEGFHRPDPAYKHLGRFTTGKARKEATSIYG